MSEFDALRASALEANLALPKYSLVTLTWGNASVYDATQQVIAIKPSGVPYEQLTIEDMVVLGLDGTHLAGDRSPSTDTPTHLALYRAFDSVGAIVHTHSTWATAWAQAQRQIPVLGTTHADLTDLPIPLTRHLTPDEITEGYEHHTATVLIEAVSAHGPDRVPCALVRGHAPFVWGPHAHAAVQNAVTLEAVAHMAWLTTSLAPDAPELDAAVRSKHHVRKHGPDAYYGQR